jgi:hypothetical protein
VLYECEWEAREEGGREAAAEVAGGRIGESVEAGDGRTKEGRGLVGEQPQVVQVFDSGSERA